MLSLRSHYNTKAVIVVAVVRVVVVAVGGTEVVVVVVPRAPAQDPKWRTPFLHARRRISPEDETCKNSLAQPPGVSVLKVRNPAAKALLDLRRRHLSTGIHLLIPTQPPSTPSQIIRSYPDLFGEDPKACKGRPPRRRRNLALDRVQPQSQPCQIGLDRRPCRFKLLLVVGEEREVVDIANVPRPA